MERLRALHGTWRGQGAGDYPTIEAFRYDETLRFEFDGSYPLLHYEQRTWLTPDREPSHWESGFLRVTEEGLFELSCAQGSGRVEVLRGPAIEGDDGSLRLELDSVMLGHDERLVRTRRVLTLLGDKLGYVKFMATHTTPEPALLQHLEAALTRE